MKHVPASGKFGESMTLFRPQVALQLQRVHPEASPHLHSVNVELAPAESFKVDWDSGITVQVSLRELPRVASILIGLVPSTVYRYHGENKNRGYELLNTKESRSWSVFSPQGKLFFNFTHDEAFWLADFVMGALLANSRATSMTDIMNLLRQTVSKG